MATTSRSRWGTDPIARSSGYASPAYGPRPSRAMVIKADGVAMARSTSRRPRARTLSTKPRPFQIAIRVPGALRSVSS